MSECRKVGLESISSSQTGYVTPYCETHGGKWPCTYATPAPRAPQECPGLIDCDAKGRHDTNTRCSWCRTMHCPGCTQGRDTGQPEFLLDMPRRVMRKQYSEEGKPGLCARCYQVRPCRTIQELDWIEALIGERDAALATHGRGRLTEEQRGQVEMARTEIKRIGKYPRSHFLDPNIRAFALGDRVRLLAIIDALTTEK
jgi:hypothetical protein